jgi:hypothetical protein
MTRPQGASIACLDGLCVNCWCGRSPTAGDPGHRPGVADECEVCGAPLNPHNLTGTVDRGGHFTGASDGLPASGRSPREAAKSQDAGEPRAAKRGTCSRSSGRRRDAR